MTQPDPLAVLSEPLTGLQISEHERSILQWLSGCEVSTAAGVAALLWKARNAEPPRDRVMGTPPFDGAHPVRVALVLDVLELVRGHGYRRGAQRSLADLLRHLNALVTAYEADRS
jgi:hypothetical protein